MTNLDSIFKSRDITLPTKVHLGKAMVFPVVMCGCESWTVKKAEHRSTDALKIWCCNEVLSHAGGNGCHQKVCKQCGEGVEKREPSSTVGGNAN